jgi:hypothetical protein
MCTEICSSKQGKEGKKREGGREGGRKEGRKEGRRHNAILIFSTKIMNIKISLRAKNIGMPF